MGYQGLELGIIGLAVDGDPGAGVDAEVSGAGLFGFGAGQSGLDNGLAISHGSPPCGFGTAASMAQPVSVTS